MSRIVQVRSRSGFSARAGWEAGACGGLGVDDDGGCRDVDACGAVEVVAAEADEERAGTFEAAAGLLDFPDAWILGISDCTKAVDSRGGIDGCGMGGRRITWE